MKTAALWLLAHGNSGRSRKQNGDSSKAGWLRNVRLGKQSRDPLWGMLLRSKEISIGKHSTPECEPQLYL